MYQALYRKYRPKSFSDVIGQDHITQTLRRQVESGRTSHAYLFVGTRGTGKTTCAKILSRALNCEHPVNGDPCNECASCMGIESGAVLDVVEIDAASNNGVDNIRAIRDEAVYSPASVKKRVYIIDEVHMLSNSAFNALLKILEEPPEHLVFILATTELNKVPATILSRCQRFSFKRIMPEDIVRRIKYIASEEHIEITDGAAFLLARLGDGSMRDALSLFDQCLNGGRVDEAHVLASVGLSGAADTADMWEKLKNGDLPSVFSAFERQYLGGTDPSSALGEILSLARDMMISKIAPQSSVSLLSGSFGADQLISMSGGVTTAQLIACSEAIQESLAKMAAVKDKRTAAEVCLIKLCGILTGKAQVMEPAPPALQPGAYRKIPPAQPSAPVSVPKPAPVPQPEPPKNEAPAPAPWEDELPPITDDDVPPEHTEPFVPEPAPHYANHSEPVPPAPQEHQAPQIPQEHHEEVSSPSSSASSANLWERIASSLMSSPDMAFLSDTSSVSARDSGMALNLTTNNDFYLRMFSRPDIKNLIAEAASKELGHPTVVNVAKGEVVQELRTDKLDELARFGNVKFIN